MNCPWHPNKRAIASCKDCGTDFCIECVRETDQTTLCPDCFRRKISEIAREFTETTEAQEEARPAAAKTESAAAVDARAKEELSPFDGKAAPAAPRAAAPPAKKSGLRDRVRRKKGVGKTPPQPVAAPPPLFGEEAAEVEVPQAEPPVTSRAEAPPAAPREATTAGAPPAAPREAIPSEAAKAVPAEAPQAEAPQAAPRAAVPEREKSRFGRRDKSRRKKEESGTQPQPSGDFLAQGPDDDFSQLGADSRKPGRWSRGAKKAAETQAVEGGEAVRAGEEDAGKPEAAEKDVTITAKTAPVKPEKEKAAASEKVSTSDDDLLQDVMSTLLTPEAGSAEAKVAAAPEAVITAAPAKASDGKKTAKARAREARLRKKEAGALEKKAKPAKERDLERWSFLAQPRSSEYTLIAVSWWRAAIFIILMLLLGAVLWAVPNAYLIPKDQEYGIHAVAIGFVIGLAFWWKAGKKHSSKLAVQAALTTLFALFVAEFLHWFLIITKYDAFRTIFFDLVSFKFLWENGADILRYTMEAMFPIAFLWLLFLPTVTAFIIGFGMPPIPEIFVQIWHAIKGEAAEEKEASHGLEG